VPPTAQPEPRLSALPELGGVHWRARVDERSLARSARLWTATTIAHGLPLLAVAALLTALKPVVAPILLIALAYAWTVPELYAWRGAKVLRPRARTSAQAERVALGLLGDLLGHDARELLGRTGLVVERASLGVWILGEAGAVLVRPGGRRVHCYCVKVADPDMPPADRIAHLLLALRADEIGFATVANLAFSGARWRLRRRLNKPAREALDTAVGRS
jgi:hypothetical protein